MKQVTINIPENKYKAFMKLIQSLDYISITKSVESNQQSLSNKFRAKIPKEIGIEMHKQLEDLRKEWERDI